MFIFYKSRLKVYSIIILLKKIIAMFKKLKNIYRTISLDMYEKKFVKKFKNNNKDSNFNKNKKIPLY
jgi:hypothetical protein